MLKNGFLWILVLLFTASCGIINIKKSGSSTSRFDSYNEDISNSRITFAELPEAKVPTADTGPVSVGAGNAVDKDLEEALAHFAKSKEEEPYFSGFTILVYSGVDRDLAFKTRNDLYSAFPEIKTFMQYQQPRYLVKVGKYINRIEALYLFEKIKEQFPIARIIQDRFQRESLGNEQEIQNAEGEN